MNELSSPQRIAFAMFAGATVAALLWRIIFFLPASRYEQTMLFALLIATVVWAAGSTLIAGPVWIILHRVEFAGLGLLRRFAHLKST